MEIKSPLTERKHVIDIEATYDGSRVTVTLQVEDVFEDKGDFYYVRFKTPNELELPDSEMMIYKTGLRAITIHHRFHEYLVEGVTLEQYRRSLQKRVEADQADQPEQIGIESTIAQDPEPPT